MTADNLPVTRTDIPRVMPHAVVSSDVALTGRLNWLRAGVLGANDGIVSVAAVIVGFESATLNVRTILLAGLAALIGGAVSMALGEYVSVSSQKDSQRAHKSEAVVASPWHAALASAVAFLAGGVVPFLGILLPHTLRIPGTVVLVLIALAAAGLISAHLGRAPAFRATVRVLIGGALALGFTYLLGSLMGMHGL